MARIIAAKIDVTKIPKDKIFTGQKGKYIDVTIAVNDDKNQFDQDVSISIGQTAEERQAKAPKTFIGNGKTVWTSESGSQHQSGGKAQPSMQGYESPF